MSHSPYNKYNSDHVRVDRDKLVFDSNISNSLLAASDLDHTTIQSRIGDPNHTLKPGYCLQFNASNPDAYIQTKIPSSQRENYNVIIKSNGFYSMYVDSSSEYIAIRQITPPVNTEYCEISYIAFKNRTTGKLDYLFECEEGSGTLLYDAITGQTATLCSSAGESVIASLSELRTTSRQKQWVKDERNLETCCVTKDLNLPFSKKNIITKLPFSICFDFEVDNAEEINYYLDSGGGNIYTCLWYNYSSESGGVKISLSPYLSRFIIQFYNPPITLEDGTTSDGYVYYYIHYNQFPRYKAITSPANARRQFLKDGRHKLVLIFDGEINDAGVYSIRKAFLDGEQAYSKSSVDQQDLEYQLSKRHHTTEFALGDQTIYLNSTQYSPYVPKDKTKNKFFSNIRRYDTKIFNYDISLEGVPYSVNDWFNGRDIPQELLLVDTSTNTDNNIKQCNLSLKHNIDEQMDRMDTAVKYSYLTDETINKNNVGNTTQRFYEDYRGNLTCFPNEQYGTWMNNVGYTETEDGVFLPRKVLV